MNDPNKAINVNLSSLLSLKAELLRKQAEVNKAKALQQPQNQQNEEYASKMSNSTNGSNSASGHEERTSKKDKKTLIKEVEKQNEATVYEHEDSELLEKSKRVLEAKSKFYERMTRTGGKLNSDDNCLVLFNRKRQDERNIDSESPQKNDKYEQAVRSNDTDSDTTDSEVGDNATRHDNNHDDDEEDWVEYTDCLGRTRKCLREDLEAAKRRDAELAASMPERLDQSKANWMLQTRGSEKTNEDASSTIGPMPPSVGESVFGDGISMMSKHDEQRANWERKEQENLDKVDVHYQDVFFDEARQHGVGYYAFSTDEEERRKQQKELEESRKHTIAEQKRRDELRAQREKIITERVHAAKNRQRARLGLPPLPLEDEEKQNDETNPATKETKEERKARKRANKLKRKQEQEEKERELERQQHIRPWDREKQQLLNNNAADMQEVATEEPKWAYKPERRAPMSQEEWNEKKRAERVTEFGPIPETNLTERQPAYQPKRTNFTSVPPPPIPTISEPIATHHNPFTTPSIPNDNFASFQTSKPNRKFHRRNYETTTTTAEDEGEEAQRSGGFAIPPPIDLDYVPQPPHAKRARGEHALEQSIEAGLRFLRDNCDKGNLTTKSSWTAKADY